MFSIASKKVLGGNIFSLYKERRPFSTTLIFPSRPVSFPTISQRFYSTEPTNPITSRSLLDNLVQTPTNSFEGNEVDKKALDALSETLNNQRIRKLMKTTEYHLDYYSALNSFMENKFQPYQLGHEWKVERMYEKPDEVEDQYEEASDVQYDENDEIVEALNNAEVEEVKPVEAPLFHWSEPEVQAVVPGCTFVRMVDYEEQLDEDDMVYGEEDEEGYLEDDDEEGYIEDEDEEGYIEGEEDEEGYVEGEEGEEGEEGVYERDDEEDVDEYEEDVDEYDEEEDIDEYDEDEEEDVDEYDEDEDSEELRAEREKYGISKDEFLPNDGRDESPMEYGEARRGEDDYDEREDDENDEDYERETGTELPPNRFVVINWKDTTLTAVEYYEGQPEAVTVNIPANWLNCFKKVRWPAFVTDYHASAVVGAGMFKVAPEHTAEMSEYLRDEEVEEEEEEMEENETGFEDEEDAAAEDEEEEEESFRKQKQVSVEYE